MRDPILRHGRHIAIHLYEQQGPEPADSDPAVGSVWVEPWATRIVEAMNSDPGEVVRLRELVDHYRHRAQMSPSERQSYLGEDADKSCEPERYAYRSAAEGLAANLGDPSAMEWTIETADRLGIGRNAATSLMAALAMEVRNHGRPLSASAKRMIQGDGV